jgi:hypothetical protein
MIEVKRDISLFKLPKAWLHHDIHVAHAKPKMYFFDFTFVLNKLRHCAKKLILFITTNFKLKYKA